MGYCDMDVIVDSEVGDEHQELVKVMQECTHDEKGDHGRMGCWKSLQCYVETGSIEAICDTSVAMATNSGLEDGR